MPEIINIVKEMKYLYEYMDITRFLNRGFRIREAESICLPNKEYPVIMPWQFEKELDMVLISCGIILPKDIIETIKLYIYVPKVEKQTKYSPLNRRST